MTRRDVLIKALTSTPNDLRLLSTGIGPTAAVWRVAPDTWSALDIACHLLAIERPYLQRLQRVIAEDSPHVPLLHPDESRHDLRRELSGVLADFAAARRETVAFLQSLPPGHWQRVGIHERKGPMSLRFLVQDLVTHDIDHTSQLVETLQRYRAVGAGAKG